MVATKVLLVVMCGNDNKSKAATQQQCDQDASLLAALLSIRMWAPFSKCSACSSSKKPSLLPLKVANVGKWPSIPPPSRDQQFCSKRTTSGEGRHKEVIVFGCHGYTLRRIFAILQQNDIDKNTEEEEDVFASSCFLRSSFSRFKERSARRIRSAF